MNIAKQAHLALVRAEKIIQVTQQLLSQPRTPQLSAIIDKNLQLLNASLQCERLAVAREYQLLAAHNPHDRGLTELKTIGTQLRATTQQLDTVSLLNKTPAAVQRNFKASDVVAWQQRQMAQQFPKVPTANPFAATVVETIRRVGWHAATQTLSTQEKQAALTELHATCKQQFPAVPATEPTVSTKPSPRR